jgi:ABC-2 type transport system permease protein
LSAADALARQALRDGRTRNIAFACLFAAVAYIQPVAYRRTYPTRSDRVGFARSFGGNKAIRLFYGVPHDLLTVGGYSAWRVGGLLAIFAAVWGLLAAVRALRTEEEAGRTELVLAGIVSRGYAFLAALAAIAVGTAILWTATFVGLAAAGLPARGSAFLALATVSVVPVFVGVGALASQVASSRRLATGFAAGAFLLALVVRVVADTSSQSWLRWITPLGWVEELRPFAGTRPLVLILPVAAGGLLIAAAGLIAARRDVGAGLLPARDSGPPRMALLASPTAFALRSERGSLAGWLTGIAAFAFILGVVSNTVSSAGIPKSLARQVERLGTTSITTPAGYLGFTFLFFVLAISLFCCSQLATARHEEASERLETLLALPVDRGRWLAGRLLLAIATSAALALAAGALAWAGAASQGVMLSLPRLLEAGANCLPAALLFLGLAALAFAIFPRASPAISYGLVSVGFVWDLFGALLGAPHWLVELSPFQQVGLVPAEAFKTGGAIAMLAIAAIAGASSVACFRRRDLNGA